MPITPIHFGFNVLVYYLTSLVFPVEFLWVNTLYLLSAELIDLDHLWSKPIYKPGRNSLTTHFLHKNWKWVGFFSLLSLPFHPLRFIGLGLISHLFLDYIHAKYFMEKF